MYVPKHFEMSGIEKQMDFMRAHSFATVMSTVDGRPVASHLPLLVYETDETDVGLRICGHFARANPQWQSFDGQTVLAVFSGPDAYISPAWYGPNAPDVPTWDYMAVHATGTAHVFEGGEALHNLLRETVHLHDPALPLLQHLDEDMYRKLERAVVGFEIRVEWLEGKAKLSQNKSDAIQLGIIVGLLKQGTPAAQDVAAAIRKNVLKQSVRKPEVLQQ